MQSWNDGIMLVIPIDWIGLDNQFISTEFKSGVKFKIFVLLIESKVQSNGERGDGRDAELFVGGLRCRKTRRGEGGMGEERRDRDMGKGRRRRGKTNSNPW